MTSHAKTRDYGISLDRLPGYSVVANPDAASHPGAIALRVEMLKFVTTAAAIRVNGAKSAFGTIEKAREILSELCLRLWRLGYQVTKIDKINGKHIEAVVRDHWANGASPKHLAAIMTQLNKFDDWIGKPGMVKSKEFYLPEVDPKELQVKGVADKSKSWTQNGIDVQMKISEADRLDKRFGLMLRLCVGFGLRRCEVLQIKPWLDDKRTFLDIRAGIAKGGRARTIPFDHEAQREVLDYVKANIEKKEHLGWVDGRATGIGLLLRNRKRYAEYMAKIGISKADAGVTGHGLRAEYAEDMSMLMGLIPATRGGTKGQMDKEDQDLIRLRLSENLGHSRLAVTNAYIGSLTKKIQNSRGDRLGAVLLDGQKMAAFYMNPPPKLGLNGEYQRLSKRNIEGTDILVVIEDVSTGVSEEVCEFLFKDTEQEIVVEKDCTDIRRIGGALLARFGVVI